MSNWATDAYAEIETLKGVATDLANLAYVMDAAGNQKISRETSEYYSKIAVAALKLEHIVRDKIDADMKRADENSWNVMQAAIAGAEVARLGMERAEERS